MKPEALVDSSTPASERTTSGTAPDQTLISGSRTRRIPASATPLGHASAANNATPECPFDPDATVMPRAQADEWLGGTDRGFELASSAYDDPMSRLRVGDEQAGRYTYVSPDGADGSELGRGAIGRVLIAADQHLGRDVAIKELLPEVFSQVDDDEAEDIRARFIREARITGQLEHPNIVPVYELGRRGDGRLYYTMKVIRGRTLDAAIEQAATLEQRLALMHHFFGLCQAIAYAHSRGVVHRDIKPQNVMIGEFGETIVLDWGVAKVQDASEQQHASLPPVKEIHDAHAQATLQGNVFGTPIYMSPEQATGDVSEIDERSDVWSLGVVLYTLLSGRLPFDGSSVGDVISRVMAGDARPLRELDERIPPELEAVTQRALARDKHERYRTAKEMMRDVEAFLSGARVGAYAYSSWELVRRFVGRHRAAVGVAVIALLAGSVLAIGAYRRVAEARDRAVQAEEVSRDSAEQARANLAQLFAKQAELASSSHDHTAAELFAAKALTLLEIPGARGQIVGSSNTYRPTPRFDFDPDPKCERVWQQTSHVLCRSGHEINLFELAPSETWGKLLTPPVAEDELVRAAARISLGARFAGEWQVALRGDQALIAGSNASVVLDLKSGQVQRRLDGLGSAITAVATDSTRSEPDPDRSDSASRRWLIGLANGAVVGVDEAGRRTRVGRVSQPISALAWSGDEIAMGGKYGQLELWASGGDAGLESIELSGHMGTITSLAFSPAGRWLVSASADRTVRLWRRGQPTTAQRQPQDTTSQQRLQQTWPTDAVVTSLDWSWDEQLLTFADEDRGVFIADLRLSQPIARARGHQWPASMVRLFGKQERFLLSSSPDKPLRFWSLGSGHLPQRLVARGNILALAATTKQSGAPSLWAGGIGRNGVCLWSIEQQRCSTRLPVQTERVRDLALSADGQRLAIAGSQGLLQVWDTASLVPLHILTEHREEVRAVAFDSTGNRLYSTGKDRKVMLWDLTRSELLASAPLGAAGLALAFNQDRQLVVGTAEGELAFFNAELSSAGARIKLHDDWVMDMERLGEQLVTAGADGKVVIWSGADDVPRVLEGHTGRVTSVSVSPDGRWIASSGEDRTVRVWSTQDFTLAARLEDHQGTVRSLGFIPGSSVLISGGDDRTLRLWDLAVMDALGETILQRAQRDFGVRLLGSEIQAENRAVSEPVQQPAQESQANQ